MDVLKAQLLRIQQQLAGLNATQKMLTASLVAIMVMTMLWWARFAASPEMEQLLPQNLTAEEVTRISKALTERGVDYRIDGSRIMVPVARLGQLRGELSSASLMPTNMREGFDNMMKQVSPWDSPTRSQDIRNDARAVLMAEWLRSFPGVSGADVYIDPNKDRRIGSNGPRSVATVHLTTSDKRDAAPKKLVAAAADLVSGAVSGLNRKDISVVINGVSYKVPDPGNLIADTSELLSNQQEYEQMCVDKIERQLYSIPGVRVSVTVDVNVDSKTEKDNDYDPKRVATGEVSSDTTTDENTNSAATPGEVGVAPNVGLTLNQPAAGGGNTSTKETSRSTRENRFSQKITEIISPAGKAKVLGATVLVPRSYFIGSWKSMHPTDTAEPDAATLDTYIKDQITWIKNTALRCTNLTDATTIAVDMFPDFALQLASAAKSTESSPGVSVSLTSHTKEVAIGLLAVVSLFMVSMMVKKGAPAPLVIPPPPARQDPQPLTAEEAIAGIVGGDGGTLDGMELDDDSVRAQQMVDQVTTMVKENPDAAANLVKRWMNR